MTGSSARGPVELGHALDRLLGSLDAAPSDLVSTIFGRWEDLVGADVARHCRPAAVEGDRLVVVATDPAWASELQWLAADVLARINEAASTERLKSLTVRVAPSAD